MRSRDIVLKLENRVKNLHGSKKKFSEEKKLNEKNVSALFSRVLRGGGGAGVEYVEDIANALGVELVLIDKKTRKEI